MKKSIFLCFLLALSVALFSQKTDYPREDAILKLHLKKFDWMVHQQYDSLKNVLDDRLVYIHSNGWAETKAEVIADLQSGKLNYTSVKVSAANARVFNGAVIITGKGIFSVLMDGKALDIQLYYTEVYVKKKTGWKLASRHANKI